jgi:hypothetical protein
MPAQQMQARRAWQASAQAAQVLAMLARTRPTLLRTAPARRASSLARLVLARLVLARLALARLALARLVLRRPARARWVPGRPVFAQVLTALPAILAWMGPVRAAALLASRRLRRVSAAYLARSRQPSRQDSPRPAWRRARRRRSCPPLSVRAAHWLPPRARQQHPPGSLRTERMGVRQLGPQPRPRRRRRQQAAAADRPPADRRHPGRQGKDASLPAAMDRPVLPMLLPACPGRFSRARPGPAALRVPARRAGLPAGSDGLAPAHR